MLKIIMYQKFIIANWIVSKLLKIQNIEKKGISCNYAWIWAYFNLLVLAWRENKFVDISLHNELKRGIKDYFTSNHFVFATEVYLLY